MTLKKRCAPVSTHNEDNPATEGKAKGQGKEKIRIKPIRSAEKTRLFEQDWVRVAHSGKHDLQRVKEAMLLLIANDGPLGPEWRDHELKGRFAGTRELHVKGDLLLVYQLDEDSMVVFTRLGTHSELFG